MFRLINSLKNKKGFTLIELIVVLAVLAIIMAIAVPRFLGIQEQAKKDADVSSLGLIAKTAELYYVQDKIKSTDDDTTIIAALKSDFPNGVSFKSKEAGASADLDDVKFTITAGVIKAKVGTLESK